eukprot:TRINITY_DN96167_c0_g1_i1.p1 TRINITY_DN96167_c0_g1~~TRINITY_DN96167_c0_g1_i1.p1  ORF type:complete len:259 (+),score=50.73 TRINITY_DN96167_c0_g1_i1:132-908(+)
MSDLYGWGGKKVQDGIISGEINQNWFFCIPIQIGPATEYARKLRSWFLLIILLQAAEIPLQIILAQALLTALWCAVTALVGLYAWHQDMNITYICAWGIICLFMAVTSLIEDIFPGLFGVLSLDVPGLIIMASVIVVNLMGAAFAWHLYNDYRRDHGRKASSYDPFATVADKFDPSDKIPFAKAENAVDKAADRLFGTSDDKSSWPAGGGGNWFGEGGGGQPLQTNFYGAIGQAEEGVQGLAQEFLPPAQRKRQGICC